MAKIPTKLRLNDQFNNEIDKVQNLVDDAYTLIAPNLNRKVDIVIRETDAPTTSDVDHDMASFWLRRSPAALWILTDIDETASPRTATWTSII